MTRLSVSIAISILGWLFGAVVFAVPMASQGFLPIDSHDIDNVRQRVKGDEELIRKFVSILNQINIFPDHANEAEPKLVSDRNVPKKYWAVPFLSPSSARGPLGSLAVADHTLGVLDELDNLAISIKVDLWDLSVLMGLIDKVDSRIRTLSSALRLPDRAEKKALLQDEITWLQQQHVDHQKNIDDLAKKNAGALREVPTEWIKRVVSAMIYQLARLGMGTTSSEEKMLQSNDVQAIVTGLAQVRKRAAQGQLAVQEVVLDAGLNDVQADVLGLYMVARPDVTIKSIGAKGLYAKPALQQTTDIEENRLGGLPRIIRAVNGEEDGGACQSSSACNVVIEYTEMGARWVSGATTGSVLMPVYFEANVAYKQPPFDGSLDCKFKNGLMQKGLDSKDGGIIYDADVYAVINLNGFDENGCVYATNLGDETSAHFHALNTIYNSYIWPKAERAQKSLTLQEATREKYEAELSHLQIKLKTREPENHREALISTLLTFSSPFTKAIAIIEKMDSFYWHTKMLDNEDSNELNIQEQISVDNLQVTERRAFDAFPVVCWKNAHEGEKIRPYPVACSMAAMLVPNNVDTMVGRTQENCGGARAPFSGCREIVNDGATTNEHGERIRSAGEFK